MKQADLGLNLTTKRTRKREFLAQMERVVPWAALVDLIAPHAPEGKRGRPPFPIETMLRIHFMQQWFTLSDPAMEEALHGMPLFREFAGLGWDTRMPDESTILRFRHLLERHKLPEQILAVVNELLRDKGLMLKTGTGVDATLISAPSSTKNASGQRDPDMHQTKKGNQWHFGMKAHIGVDADSGLVHGDETEVLADAGYQGADKRPDAKEGVDWHVAMHPGKRRALDKTRTIDRLIDQIERLKASIRAKVEHPFRVIKRQFGHVKLRYRGSKKDTAPPTTLFALSNLWMARRHLHWMCIL